MAFRRAAAAGYDGAELDVQLTRDGQLVVFHDFRLKPELCRGPDGAWLKPPLPLIRELSLAELQTIDVGRPKPGTLYARAHPDLVSRDGEHMPSLGDVMVCVRAANPAFRLFVEIKTSFEDPTLSAKPEGVAEAVVDELKRMRFMDHATLVGFDWPALIHAKRLEPKLGCWFTSEKGGRFASSPGRAAPWAGGFDPYKFGSSFAQAIRSAGGDGWLCARNQATPKALEQARACGLQFGVWTANEPHDMRALAEMGVDAICTDRPDKLQAVLS
jgi:glycerophosphoryl diester phosphodiesterase